MESGGSYHKLPTLSSSSSSEMSNDPKRKKTTRNGGGDEEECKVREQDRFMPVANVIRIMRRIVPAHGKISDDAKETMQECVSEFIGFVTGEANDRCQREQRKTITAEDVLFAMSKLGFDSYVDPLSLFLHRYRHLESRPPTYDYQPTYYAHPPPPAFDSPYHNNG